MYLGVIEYRAFFVFCQIMSTFSCNSKERGIFSDSLTIGWLPLQYLKYLHSLSMHLCTLYTTTPLPGLMKKDRDKKDICNDVQPFQTRATLFFHS